MGAEVGVGVEVGSGAEVGVAVGSGTATAFGVVDAASATTCEGPNGVNARATEIAMVTKRAGWPIAVRTRARGAVSRFKLFTLCDSVGWSCGD